MITRPVFFSSQVSSLNTPTPAPGNWEPRGALRTCIERNVKGLGGALLEESIGLNYKIAGCYMLTSKLCLHRHKKTSLRPTKELRCAIKNHTAPLSTLLSGKFSASDFSLPVSCGVQSMGTLQVMHKQRRRDSIPLPQRVNKPGRKACKGPIIT